MISSVTSAYTGQVNLDSDATVGQLRQKIHDDCHQRNNSASLGSIKLIIAGRNLSDDRKTLAECGFTARARMLVLKHAAADRQELDAASERQKRELDVAAERSERIKRLKQAIDSMATRGERRSEYSLQLENQDGTPLKIDLEQQSLLMMGMMLHASAARHLEHGDWAAALNDLELAEESFNLCSSDLLGVIDNVGLLLLDSVWCLFKLQDNTRLAAAQEKLAKARQQLAASHGQNLERLRVLHGNFRPELAIYVRLEMLEGLALFYSGSPVAAHERLSAARDKWRQLSVSDNALASLINMGFSTSEASRALRFTGGNVGDAATFVLEQRKRAAERHEQDRKRRAAAKEVETMGRTAGGAIIDVDALLQLAGLGFDRTVAAEALRQAENNQEAAMIALLDPEQSAALHLAAAEQASQQDSHSAAERTLLDMGYAKFYVREALKAQRAAGTAYDVATALDTLAAWAAQRDGVAPSSADQAGEPANGSHTASDAARKEPLPPPPPGAQPAVAVAAAADTAADVPPLPHDPREDCDVETEREVAGLVEQQGKDALSGYDVDVNEEGQVIQEFLARLEQPAAG